MSIKLFESSLNSFELESDFLYELLFQSGIRPSQQFPYLFLRFHNWVYRLPHIEVILRILI